MVNSTSPTPTDPVPSPFNACISPFRHIQYSQLLYLSDSNNTSKHHAPQYIYVHLSTYIHCNIIITFSYMADFEWCINWSWYPLYPDYFSWHLLGSVANPRDHNDPVYPCRSSTAESLKSNAISNANDKNTFIISVNKQQRKRHLTAKIPLQTAKFPDIPVKTEFPNISWFSRKWEPW